MIRTAYPDRICYRPGCDDRECRVLLPKGVRIEERATIPLGYITSGILLPPPFHPDVLHPEFCSAVIQPGCLTSRWSCSSAIPPGCLTSETHLLRIFRIRRLPLDGRGGRFNFHGQTYPDPLIALIRRVSQPFLHSAAVFS